MRPCPISGSTLSGHKWGIKNLYECSICSQVYVDPLPTPRELENIYTENYFIGGIKDYDDYLSEKQALQANFVQRIKRLRHFRDCGNLFEIGCAYGFFLDVAKEYWQVKGADISTDAVWYAANRLGLDVRAGSIETLNLPTASLDVVALWDTIEHLYDPVLAMKKIAAALRREGIVALTTGDICGVLPHLQKASWRLYQPNHLYNFQKDQLLIS